MQRITFLSVCLACAAYGRKEQLLDKKLQRSPFEEGASHSLDALGKLFLAFNPSAELVHYVSTSRSVVGNPIPQVSQSTAFRLHHTHTGTSENGGSTDWRISHARSSVPRMQKRIPESPEEIGVEAIDALSKALTDGQRRVEMTLPDGLVLYGEIPTQTGLGNPDEKYGQVLTSKGDRDFAYLISESFGKFGDSVALVLGPGPSNQKDMAERDFEDGQLATKIFTSAEKMLPKQTSGGGGFQKIKRAKYRVLILIRADKKMLETLDPIIEPMGKEIIVVLVNPKPLRNGKNRPGYVPVYVLKDNPHPEWKGGIVYRRYPGQWILGVAGAKGESCVSERSDDRPKLSQLNRAFTKIKEEKNWFERAKAPLGAKFGGAAALERKKADADDFEGEEDASDVVEEDEVVSYKDKNFFEIAFPFIKLPEVPNPFEAKDTK